jgi:hypothetical protein
VIDTGRRARWAHWGPTDWEQIPGTRAHAVSLVVHFALIGFSL